MTMLGVQIGWGEVLLVVAVILLLFGARRLPELARAIGRSGRELRDGFSGDEGGDDRA